jgi:IS5 family transposase
VPDHAYRQLLDVLSEMPRTTRLFGLSIDELPNFTTLCHAIERLSTPNWRRFLTRSTRLHDLGEVQAIDASGFDRIAASRKYANWTNYTFNAMKTTVLVDCSSVTILDIHASTKRPHNTAIARQLLSRNVEKGGRHHRRQAYDSTPLRRFLQAHGFEPMIKFGSTA